MTATAADEQDLAKALDSVAGADKKDKDASSDAATKTDDTSSSSSSVELPPIVPPDSPVAPKVVLPQPPEEPAFPPITPLHGEHDPSPPDASALNGQRVISPLRPTPAPASENAYGIPTPPAPEVEMPAPEVPAAPEISMPDVPAPIAPMPDVAVDAGPLADIKKDALNELRPLVDKLNVSPEEKFDTLLLLIRSTDDSSLIGPAHEAAKLISDEARRAEALLDIIKEIDYLSHQKAA